MEKDLYLVADVESVWAEDTHDANVMLIEYSWAINDINKWDNMDEFNYYRDGTSLDKEWLKSHILWRERVMRAYVARRKLGEKVSMRDVKKDIPRY